MNEWWTGMECFFGSMNLLDEVICFTMGQSALTTLSFVDNEFGFELHSLFGQIPSKLAHHFAGKVIEYTRQPISILRRSDAIINSIPISKLLTFLLRKITQIVLVTYQINALFWNVLLDGFINVIVAFLERFRVGKVEDANTTVSAFVVTWCESSEFLLTGGVPDL